MPATSQITAILSEAHVLTVGKGFHNLVIPIESHFSKIAALSGE
jgi:hypothetical protein